MYVQFLGTQVHFVHFWSDREIHGVSYLHEINFWDVHLLHVAKNPYTTLRNQGN